MEIQAEESAERWAPRWWAVFFVGLVLWGATIAVGRVTRNVILLPTIVLLGSFLVPITAVVWYLDHDPSPALSPRRIVTAFLIGGVLGVLGASLLEYWLVNVGLIGAFEVGLIEEFVKGLFIVVVALGISRFHIRDGMVLGGTVGFGFAALESSGYALASLFVVQGNQLILSLNSVIFTELVRGVLAPFGHGLWSAILGGAIFAAARRGGLRLTWGILGTYLLLSALHGTFDSMSSIWGIAMVSLIGLIPFIWLWRRGDAGGVLPRRRRSVG
jgi:RsiW-degrading membrane proteinase PrsW (M82 family)